MYKKLFSLIVILFITINIAYAQTRLTNFTVFALNHNNISDISPLAGLVNLEILQL